MKILNSPLKEALKIGVTAIKPYASDHPSEQGGEPGARAHR